MAIAFLTSNDNDSDRTNTVTVSISPNGAETFIFAVAMLTDTTSPTFTGVTYDGNAMTQLYTFNNAARYYKVYGYLAGTTDGSAKNCVATVVSPDYGVSMCVSAYSGAKQSALPTVDDDVNSGAGGTLTVNLTTTVDDCWLIGGAMQQDEGTNKITAGTGAYERVENANIYNYNDIAILDSNGSVGAAGAKSIQAISSGSYGFRFYALALEPASVSAPTQNAIFHSFNF